MLTLKKEIFDNQIFQFTVCAHAHGCHAGTVTIFLTRVFAWCLSVCVFSNHNPGKNRNAVFQNLFNDLLGIYIFIDLNYLFGLFLKQSDRCPREISVQVQRDSTSLSVMWFLFNVA